MQLAPLSRLRDAQVEVAQPQPHEENGSQPLGESRAAQFVIEEGSAGGV